MRHTVGLVDPIVASDQKPGERVNDGLPETLEEVVRHYGARYYKLKVGGDVAADLDRLQRIAAVLDRRCRRLPGDAGRQRAVRQRRGHCRAVAAHGRDAGAGATGQGDLFIEQPIKRAKALATSVEPLARLKPLIIDESDGELASFPAALRLGYSGVSSKNCKGLYKSILNAARVAHLNAEAGTDAAISCPPRT